MGKVTFLAPVDAVSGKLNKKSNVYFRVVNGQRYAVLMVNPRTRNRSSEKEKAYRATVGIVGNVDHSLINLGKAGRKRNMGIRPTVRGSVMNPNDHPHGGGEGKTGIGRPGPFIPALGPTIPCFGYTPFTCSE